MHALGALAFTLLLSSTTVTTAAQTPAAPKSERERVRILVLDMKSESITGETLRALRDEITIELARDPMLSVLSTEDLRAAVDLEAANRAMGCDTTSCLAEVGAAMGARYIVHANAAVVGGTRVVYVNLFDTERAEAVAREIAEAASDGQLLGVLRAAVARIRARVGSALPVHAQQPLPPPPPSPLDPLLIAGGAVAAVGAAVVIGGAAVAMTALPVVTNVGEGAASVDERLAAQETGRYATIASLLGVGVAAGGAGLFAWRLIE